MTCIEKLRELHPEWDEEKIEYFKENICPSSYMSGYIIPKSPVCDAYGWEDASYDQCKTCWNRDIYEDENRNRHETELWLTGEDMRRLDRLAARVGVSREKVVQAALKIYEEGLNAVESTRKYGSRWANMSFSMDDSERCEVEFDEQE